jgi:hypothetical protein
MVPQYRDQAFVVGGPVKIPNPTPLPVAPRFADIADWDGAMPDAGAIPRALFSPRVSERELHMRGYRRKRWLGIQ